MTSVRVLRRLRAEDEGISLVEILVSIVILGIALAAFAGTIISALGTITADEQFVRGNQAAADVIEEVRSLPWVCIGFDPDDDDYVGTATTVQLETTCTGAAYDARPRMTEDTRTIDGQSYEVTRSIDWVDVPDVPGTQNHKQITVVLDWTVRGNEYTTSTTSIRVPTPREVPVSGDAAECTPGSIVRVSITPTIVVITTGGYTNEAISVVVETCSASLDVTLDPQPLGGRSLAPQAGSDGTRWETSFGVGTPNFQPGTYPWTVAATGLDGTASAEQTMTFFAEDDLPPLNVTAITPGSVFCVDDNGNNRDRLRDAVTVTITVEGITQASQGTVTLAWTSVNDSELATFQSATPTGSTWTATVPALTRFTAESTTLSATAIRAADNADASETDVVAAPRFLRRNHNVACS